MNYQITTYQTIDFWVIFSLNQTARFSFLIRKTGLCLYTNIRISWQNTVRVCLLNVVILLVSGVTVRYSYFILLNRWCFQKPGNNWDQKISLVNHSYM